MPGISYPGETMALLDALTVSIGVLAFIAVWLFLGPFGGHLQIWAAFIAWGCYYHCGGKTSGLQNTIVSNVYGAVVGWISLYIALLVVPLGGVPLAAVIVAIGVALLVIVAKIPMFATIPANVYGFAAIAGYTLDTPKMFSQVGLTTGGWSNPFVSIVLSMIIGALFGYASDRIGSTLAAKQVATP